MNLTYDAIARFYDLSHKTLVDDIPFLLRQAAETGGPALEPVSYTHLTLPTSDLV